MDKIVTKVAVGLDAHHIMYRIEGDALHVPLPGEFGEFYVAELDGDDSIVGLVDDGWHSHGDLLMYYGGTNYAEAIILFIVKIFKGEIFLIKESRLGNSIRRTIEDDLERYLKYLPHDAHYKICNARLITSSPRETLLDSQSAHDLEPEPGSKNE